MSDASQSGDALGMREPIDRRDFMNSVLVASGSALLGSLSPSQMLAADDWTGAPAHTIGQRRADTGPLDVAALRKERDVEQGRQNHSEDRATTENNPLIRSDNAPPATPVLHRLFIGPEDESTVGEVYFLSANRGRNIAGALSHSVTLVARPIRQGDVHGPAATGVCDKRSK